MSSATTLSAYVLGDWCVRQPTSPEERATAARYELLLAGLRADLIHNTASWHHEVEGPGVVDPAGDVARDTGELDNAQCVVVFLQAKRTPKRLISLCAYAIGQRKPVLVIADVDSCRVWDYHIMHHRLVSRVRRIEDVPTEIRRRLASPPVAGNRTVHGIDVVEIDDDGTHTHVFKFQATDKAKRNGGPALSVKLNDGNMTMTSRAPAGSTQATGITYGIGKQIMRGKSRVINHF